MYVTKEESIYMRYLNQDKGLSCNQITRGFPQFRKAAVCGDMKRPINHDIFGKRIKNPGMPKKLTKRDERNIIRAVHRLRISNGSFAAKRLRTEAGIPATISGWTIRRALNRHGYRYLQSHKKGMLTSKDAYKRFKFARRMKRLSPYFWKRYIIVYFNGTLFVPKTNPAVKSRAWRRRSEDLSQSSREICPFFVAIAYKKGIICCGKYTERLNGEFFASYFHASANSRAMLNPFLYMFQSIRFSMSQI